MPRKVTLILEAVQQLSAEKRRFRVAAYCRVSTHHEEQQRSLATQISYYTNYIRNHPNWVLVGVYSDTASGTCTDQRPSYQELMRDCTKRKVDLILVKSLSRFGRDALETIRQIRRLKEMNIGVYIENGGLNTLNVSDSMIDQLAALAQAESHFRSENIKFGIRHRMRSGKTVLNHTRFLGYTKGPDGILQIVPEEAEIVRKIFDLYIQGNGVRKIKRYLEEHGYDSGYATFENANTMTVLTNGRLLIAPVASVAEMDICKWLSCSGWYVPNVPFEKKTVYIVTEAERAEFGRLLKREGENQFRLLVKIGKYSIYCSDYNFSNLGVRSSKAAESE